MRALLLVDIQNDFLPGGALAVKDGDAILPVVNELIQKPFDIIVATKDWHPKKHGSFASNHNKKIGEHIILDGLEQILWPVHCVQGSSGAEFAPGWESGKVNRIFHKGTSPLVDSYSTFFDNGHRKKTGLEEYLKDKGIKEIYIAGLATDYCVKYSALDALSLGFDVYVVLDAVKGVNLKKNDSKLALEEMKAKGAHLIHSNEF